MKLVPYEREKIKNIGWTKTKNLAILEEFLRSNYDCVEVKEFTTKSASTCAASLQVSIKRFGLSDSVFAISRKDRVFLSRK